MTAPQQPDCFALWEDGPSGCKTCYAATDCKERRETIIEIYREAQQPPAPTADAPIGMSSEDLLLLAHDEWKRREERKGNHPESHWVTGFIGGFLTDRKWAREYVAALRQRGRE